MAKATAKDYRQKRTMMFKIYERNEAKILV
jgi:hypothetical protein